MDTGGGRAAIAASLVMLLLVGACGSLSEDQCMNADWRQIGYADGTRAAPGERIQTHAQACAKYGVRPNLDAYLNGRNEGLVSFCQPENGFNQGRGGGPDQAGDCPAHLKPAFMQQYQLGRQVFPFEQEVGNLRARISGDEEELRRNDDRIERIRRELRRNGRDPKRGAALLREYNALVDQRDRIARERVYLERDLARAEQALAVKLREIGK